MKEITEVEQRTTVKVFVVAGQSNAVGYNHANEFDGGNTPFPVHLKQQKDILFWNQKDESAGTWQDLTVQEDGSFGPELSLGKALKRLLPGENIAIIKYARGGTGIARSEDYHDYIPELKNFNDNGSNWYPGSQDKPEGKLFVEFKSATDEALKQLSGKGFDYEISGFFWMQGEHEAGISPSMAKDYGELLQAFLNASKKHLGNENLPVVIGEVNSHSWAFAELARNNQKVVAESSPTISLVETQDLSREGSGGAAHFNADATLILGQRFAFAWYLQTHLHQGKEDNFDGVFAYSQPSQQDEHYLQRVQEFQAMNQHVEPGGVVLIGDSITKNFPVHKTPKAWNFHARGIAGDGIGGANYRGLLNRLHVSSHDLSPSIVIIKIGINDIIDFGNDIPRSPAAYGLQAYRKVIQLIQAQNKDTAIYVSSVLPVTTKGEMSETFEFAKYHSVIRDWNAQLKKLADQENVEYTDFHTHFIKDNEMDESLTTDGVHLNEAGYELWLGLIEKLIK